MGRYSEASHSAASTVEAQGCYLPCKIPGNNLLYFFLVECRKIKEQQPSVSASDNFLLVLKRAADEVKVHPFRCYDTKTLQQVRYIGPMLAQIVADELWSLYPCELPTNEELEENLQAQATLREVAKQTKTAAKQRSAITAAADSSIKQDLCPLAAMENNRKPAKVEKNYVPGFGTANYALVLAMFQAQAGPEQTDFLTKSALLERAEASRLSNIPLNGNTDLLATTTGTQKDYYNGWSGFNSQLIKHNIFRQWSNPKKVQLTPKGMDLAERLYRDAILRGAMQNLPNVPIAGPLIFSVHATSPVAGLAVQRSLLDGEVEIPLAEIGGVASKSTVLAGHQNVETSEDIVDICNDSPIPSNSGSLSNRLATLRETGYTARKARKLLGHSFDKYQGPEIIDVLSSSESDEDVALLHDPMSISQQQESTKEQIESGSQVAAVSKVGTHQQQHSIGGHIASGSQTLTVHSNTAMLPPMPPGACFTDMYDLILLLDGREQYSMTTVAWSASNRVEALERHISFLNGAGLKAEQRILPVGDAIWIARSRKSPQQEWVLDFILERKALNDLVSSIQQGRYDSQCYLLKRCGLSRLLYLIEGEVDKLPKPMDQKIVKTTCAQIDMSRDFKLLCTKNHQDTFRTYQKLTIAIEEYLNRIKKMADTASSTCMMFDEWKQHMQNVNQGATTLHDIWGLMLLQVPGLGAESVTCVLDHYPAPFLLWRAYNDAGHEAKARGRDPKAAAEKMLAELKSKSHGRLLGTEKSKNLFHYLFEKDWALFS